MNHTVTDAYGIDAVIKRIQEQVYPELLNIWGLTVNDILQSADVNGYGRVYKNHRDYKKIPEIFLAKEGDYQDSFYDDKADANFFFIENDLHSSTDENVFTNNMKIVFSLDLEKCYESEDRLDALAHKDVMEILRNIPSSGKYRITGYETGIERVFTGFSTKGIRHQDIHPTHVFAVLITLNYSLTDKCS